MGVTAVAGVEGQLMTLERVDQPFTHSSYSSPGTQLPFLHS